ncbi:MAG: discoidin domain-containing protein [Akkermansia sp.]|nr:discoidin domain-containing protein [Akkermansia sp.]
MSTNLVRLLAFVLAAMVGGYLVSWLYEVASAPSGSSPSRPVASAPVTQTPDASSSDSTSSDEIDTSQGVVIDEDGGVSMNDSDMVGMDVEGEDDTAWEGADDGDGAIEQDPNSYMPQPAPPAPLREIAEADVPEDPAQQVIPGVCPTARVRSIERNAKKLAEAYERLEKSNDGRTNFRSEDYAPDRWKQPDVIYKELLEKIMGKLGNGSDEAIWAFLAEPANRLDLARITLIRKIGYEGIRRITEQRMGSAMLFELTSDLDWINGVMYSGPTDRLGQGLIYLAAIYSRYSEDMQDPVARRIAATTATEFARERYSEADMLARFAYYFSSFQEGKLNKIFDTLQYWETRIVTGCREPSGWGSPQSLAWQRDNVRLPAEGYLGACNQLVYRLRNVAGDSVFSADYLGPILKYTRNTTAWAHREIGGVCGACSHYGAYGALAVGIPAMTMGEPGHCAYTVRVGNDWRMSYSIYWQHGMHKTFWGLHDWDFLILMQDLYTDRHKTVVSDQLLALAELMASRRMTKSALECFDAAVISQPLNWPAWVAYAAYLKQKAPENREKWQDYHDRVVETLAEKFHNCAATLLSRYVYPHLLPLVPNRRDRNKMFAAFFKQCDSYGTNRWDIGPLLTAHISGCPNTEEQLAYMKEALNVLMDKPEYSGAVLAWGLDYIASISTSTEENERLQEEFSELIVKTMSRARATRSTIDATWAALGEAIYTSATNGDRRTFQAIGRLAYRKCKKKFPRNRFRFRGFPGRIVSANGLIRTATTLSPGQMPHCCLHWAVLQKHGGNIPAKFEGNSGMTVELEDNSRLSGVVCLFGENARRDRDFKIEVSDDGQNWAPVRATCEVSGAVLRCDLRDASPSARFVRLLREGDKWESSVVGFYVYGKRLRESANTASED